MLTVRSEIISVGDEILRGDVVNNNAAFLGRALTAAGLSPGFCSVIPDDLAAIAAALETAWRRSSVIVLTGGLGPTPDDLTRDAVAEFCGLPLREDGELLDHVRCLFRSRGMEMPETSRNQALFPDGALKIPNAHGTATGIHVARDNRHLFALPGVYVEMRQMTEDYVIPTLRAAFPHPGPHTKILRLAGIGESFVLRALGDQSAIQSRAALAFLPHHGLLDIRITALATDPLEADAQIAHAENTLRECVGSYVYAVGEAALPAVIGNILVNRAQTLAVAESCTGGLIADMITAIPGASGWFERGWITYSNFAKIEEVDVAAALLEKHGAVSEPVARVMAEGARNRAQSAWGLATTGIAGPTGGTAEKPVGTVWIAVASAGETVARRLQFGGLRETIRLRTAHAALTLLYRQLVDARA